MRLLYLDGLETPGKERGKGNVLNGRRVVVTGLGMITPLGASLASSWEGLVNGQSGISPISSFDTEGYSVRFGGAVPDFDLGEYLPPKEARRMDGFIQYGLVTGVQAMADAGLEVTDENRHRIGVAVGSGIGGIVTIETCYDVVLNRGPGRVSPFFCTLLCDQYGRGPSLH
jgi:3-oxoacyl-[acyl-carrier-protein] synthase II